MLIPLSMLTVFECGIFIEILYTTWLMNYLFSFYNTNTELLCKASLTGIRS